MSNNYELEYIRNNLPKRVLLEGLAEECCELAQAALKTIRAIDGTNPTPMNEKECTIKIYEEITDILMVLEALGVIQDGTTEMSPKWKRWANRIKEHNESVIL